MRAYIHTNPLEELLDPKLRNPIVELLVEPLQQRSPKPEDLVPCEITEGFPAVLRGIESSSPQNCSNDESWLL